MPSPDQDYPTPLQRQLIWSGLAAFFAALLAALGVGAILLFGWVLSYLQPVLVPVAVAAILAYLLLPAVGWLRRMRGWNRRKAVYTVFGAFLSLCLLLSFMVVYPTVRQARAFWTDYLSVHPEALSSSPSAGPQDPSRPPSLAQTKLGHYGTVLLEKLDQSIGKRLEHLAPVQRFRNQEAQTWDMEEIATWLWDRLSGFLGETALFFGRGLSGATSFLGYCLGFALVPVYLFFFLRESATISRSWTDYIPLRRSRLKNEIAETLREINEYLIAYVRGQMVVSVIDAILVTIALTAIGLPYALLLGVLLAILGMIPYLGTLLVMVPAAIIALVHFGASATGTVTGAGAATVSLGGQVTLLTASGETLTGIVAKTGENGQGVEVLLHAWPWLPQVWAYPLIVVGFFIILQQINSLVTAPKIVGESVGLHPLTVIFSMLFWALLLGGLLGALLAVPLSASVKVLFRRYIWEKKLLPRNASPASPPGSAPPAGPALPGSTPPASFQAP